MGQTHGVQFRLIFVSLSVPVSASVRPPFYHFVIVCVCVFECRLLGFSRLIPTVTLRVKMLFVRKDSVQSKTFIRAHFIVELYYNSNTSSNANINIGNYGFAKTESFALYLVSFRFLLLLCRLQLLSWTFFR